MLQALPGLGFGIEALRGSHVLLLGPHIKSNREHLEHVPRKPNERVVVTTVVITAGGGIIVMIFGSFAEAMNIVPICPKINDQAYRLSQQQISADRLSSSRLNVAVSGCGAA